MNTLRSPPVSDDTDVIALVDVVLRAAGFEWRKKWTRLIVRWGWLKAAFAQHWLPLMLLVVPVGVVVWGTELESTPVLLILPAAAFVVGFVLVPRHVWFVWLGAVVIQWIAMGVFGKYVDPEDESVLSLIIEAFAWMAFGVLFPMWLGRTMRHVIDKNRRADGPSERPAN